MKKLSKITQEYFRKSYYERTKCNPESRVIEYCTDYKSKECKKTCHYAIKQSKIEKEIQSSVDFDYH